MMIQIWEVATGKAIKSLVGHDSTIMQLAYSPDGKQLMSSSADQTIKIWQIASGKETYSFQEDAACLSSVFSHDGHRIASGSEDRTVKLWALPAQECDPGGCGHYPRSWRVQLREGLRVSDLYTDLYMTYALEDFRIYGDH